MATHIVLAMNSYHPKPICIVDDILIRDDGTWRQVPFRALTEAATWIMARLDARGRAVSLADATEIAAALYEETAPDGRGMLLYTEPLLILLADIDWAGGE